MEFVAFSCYLCPHHHTDIEYYWGDSCDCAGNCCDEGSVLLKWNNKEKCWLDEDNKLRLDMNIKEEKQ